MVTVVAFWRLSIAPPLWQVMNTMPRRRYVMAPVHVASSASVTLSPVVLTEKLVLHDAPPLPWPIHQTNRKSLPVRAGMPSAALPVASQLKIFWIVVRLQA
jgi:hypothetical protein